MSGRIPAECPELRWRSGAKRLWTIHAGCVFELSGATLLGWELAGGGKLFETTLPAEGAEILPLSDETLAVLTRTRPFHSVVRLRIDGAIAGIDALASAKDGASWLTPDGMGGYVEGYAHGYGSDDLAHRDARGTIAWSGRGGMIGEHAGSMVFQRGSDLFCRRDGRAVWTTQRPGDSHRVQVVGDLVILQDSEAWNEWAEDAGSNFDDEPRVSLDAISIADGSTRWQQTTSSPLISTLGDEHLLCCTSMRHGELVRIAVADGSAMARAFLPKPGDTDDSIRLLAFDGRLLLYANALGLHCVPAASPEETVWSLSPPVPPGAAQFQEGFIACGDEREFFVFGAA